MRTQYGRAIDTPIPARRCRIFPLWSSTVFHTARARGGGDGRMAGQSEVAAGRSGVRRSRVRTRRGRRRRRARSVRRRRGLPGSRAVVGGLLVAAAAVGPVRRGQRFRRWPDQVLRRRPRGAARRHPDRRRPTSPWCPMELAPALRARVFDAAEPLLGATLVAGLGAGELVQRSAVVARKGETASRELSFVARPGPDGHRHQTRRTSRPPRHLWHRHRRLHGGGRAPGAPRRHRPAPHDRRRRRARRPSRWRSTAAPTSLALAHAIQLAKVTLVRATGAPPLVGVSPTYRIGQRLMAAERFVVLGLAPARSAWFRSVGLWANSGALPAEFVRCISVEEVRARLSSGRAFSALVADAGLPAVDRDLLAAARSAGCAVLVVDDGRATRDWLELGAARVLAPTFGRDELVAALTSCAHPVRRGEADAADLLSRPAPVAWRGSVAALTGAGGTGVSTLAIALAQALADDAAPAARQEAAKKLRPGSTCCLADLRARPNSPCSTTPAMCCRASRSWWKRTGPGQPTADDVRSLAFAVPDRRYHLLLGLRRARHWPALRPQAFEAAFDSLRAGRGAWWCATSTPTWKARTTPARSTSRSATSWPARRLAQADVVFAVGLARVEGHALPGSGDRGADRPSASTRPASSRSSIGRPRSPRAPGRRWLRWWPSSPAPSPAAD